MAIDVVTEHHCFGGVQGYFFIATFVEDHLRHHAAVLNAWAPSRRPNGHLIP